ncbi:MAG: Rrf2 family transcriptional regulator [candidate division KSB1 bacterium]|nr:Rrf2 family transcriptional regulator [candidate division KSB1 bacterium]MDZ7336214.1 Rrf2 family transcriptional regulator [candidate division KSB1 bacterium]MDZ7358953.1 Rrf2 family transcriptional regulator [candidate division KSB1 bacterium]MDZ7402348.1 Rrf2 family transcriptional regulator [candidate division KSB1 bacterium]
MKISKKGEYALRAMIYLALNYDKGTVQIRDIAKRENIPEKFLEQILLTLKKAGLLQSRQGIGGGYSLIRPPNEISLAEVIRIIDGPLAPLSCVSQWAYVKCPEEQNCGLYSVMLDVRNAIASMLENLTFEDVCKRTKGKLEHQLD